MTDLLRSHNPLTDLLAGVHEAASRPLTQATTMPPGVYGSAQFYELEVEHLFRPGWLCIGRANEVPEAGNYKCIDIIGEQLVMCRDRAGVLRVMSRICLHRWMEVVSGEGTAPAFQCPYHLWTYSLSGQLVGAPEMKGLDGFDTSQCSLPEVRYELWNGWVFINLDGQAAPLGPQLEPLDARLASYGATAEVLEAQVKIFEYDWADEPGDECAWDWKIFIENFMECYHHMGPHAKSLQKGSPAHLSWTEDSHGPYSYLHAAETEESIRQFPWFAGGGNLLHVYPLAVFALGPNGSSLHQIFPLGPGRCRVLSMTLASPADLERPDWPEQLETRRQGNSINEEDKQVNRGVQAAATARNAVAGRLSLLEQPLWEFYRWISSKLGTGVG